MNAPGQESCCIWTSRNWRPSPPAADGRCTGGETSPNWEWDGRSRASVVDDHTRLAYSEALPDEKAPTVVAFTIRALQFYRECGIPHIQEMMTDNHPCYTHSLRFKALLTLQGIKHLTIKPYNPQQNGKVERYHQTLKREWANRQAWPNEETRTQALPNWLHYYNNHRPHTSLGGKPPAARLVTT